MEAGGQGDEEDVRRGRTLPYRSHRSSSLCGGHERARSAIHSRSVRVSLHRSRGFHPLQTLLLTSIVACASSILIPYMCFYAAVIKTVIMVIDMMSANVSSKDFLDLLYNYVVSLITRVITVVLFHSLLKCMGLGFNFTDALVTWCAGSLESVAPCAASVNGGSPTCSSTCDLRSTSTRSSSVCTASVDCSAHSCKICACGVSFEGRQTDSSCSHDVQGSSLSGYAEGSSAEC